MRNGKWKANWLAALAFLVLIALGTLMVSAQEEAVGNTNAAAVEIEATPATEPAGDHHDRWRERWERREKFRDNFEENKNNSRHRPAVVVFGKHVELKTNETTEAVVVIGGGATIRGKVRDAVVAIGGDVDTEGAEIGDAVVAVLGGIKLGAGSKVHGDVVSVGGGVETAEDAVVEGEIQPVEFENFGLPNLEWLQDWFVHCVLKLRPLSLRVGWVWMVFGAFFLFYLLLAVALPRPVQVCVDEITRRPATTFFMAILTKLLLPIIVLVLLATGIGVVVVPFLLAAFFFAALVGKVAFLEYLGLALGKLFGATSLKPALALIIGTLMLALLYLVPILGLVVFGITGLWGLGAAVTASFGSLRRETDRPPNGGARANPAATTAVPMAASTAAAPPVTAAPPMTAAATMAAASPASMGGVDPMVGAAVTTADPATAAGFFAGTTQLPRTPDPTFPCEAYTLPRASFWERMGAGLLDLVLVGALCGLVGGPPYGFLVVLAYFAGMWAWKGTTVGGIVANLKVVRLDDQPVTITVALVRGLGAALSAVVLFLGFFWIAMDSDRQGWHDKIAGTVVVRVPRGRSLV